VPCCLYTESAFDSAEDKKRILCAPFVEKNMIPVYILLEDDVLSLRNEENDLENIS